MRSISFGLLSVISLVFAVATSGSALAWNSHGHMLVAAIAWHDLDDSTKERVSELLKENPQYKTWIKGVTAKDRDQVAFMRAATWPDFIKSAHGYSNTDIDTDGDAASQNIGYDDKLQHRYWHFVDEPFSTDDTDLIDPETPNAETQIIAFRDALASDDVSDDVKSYDLVWLEHLVGDVHQPLHATSRFSHTFPNGDRGGNSVKVCPVSACGSALHAYWDDLMGTGETPSSIIAQAKEIAAATSERRENTDVHSWIEDSFDIAQVDVYAPPIKNGKGPYKLTQAYKTRAKDDARDQVAIAGARLANLLNIALQ